MSDPRPETAWQIGPRTLPPPEAASRQLHDLVAQAPAPSPDSVYTGASADWKAIAAESDARHAQASEQAAAQARVRIERKTIAGVPAFAVAPSSVAVEHSGHLLVHVHGGGFYKGAGLAGVEEAVELAALVRIEVLSIDYRLAPDHPAPAAMDDVVAVWREVVAGRPAGATALGGTSAGGNLTLVGTLRAKQFGLELPGALFVGTPVADLANRGDSRFINGGIDSDLIEWDTELVHAAAFYAPGRDFDDPLLSPIFGDFDGFPPTLLVSGTRDLLLSDTVRVHRALRRAGAIAELHVYEGMGHAQYNASLQTPESAEHYAELDAFLTRHLDRPTSLR